MGYSRGCGKRSEILTCILHGYQTPQLQNFAIPPTWLSFVKASKYAIPAMAFSPHNFEGLPILHMEFFCIDNSTFFGDR